MTIAEAAKLIGVHAQTVLVLVHQGYIEADSWPGRAGHLEYEVLDDDVRRIAERYRTDPSWRKREHRRSEQWPRIKELYLSGHMPREIEIATGLSKKAVRGQLDRGMARGEIPRRVPKWRQERKKVGQAGALEK